jgi:tRNA-modifying protein YgfZ
MTSSGRITYLQSRAVIEVFGPDWRSFLQGLLTNDVETLKPGEARFCALLTPQGRILFDLFVICREDGCLLDVTADLRDRILERLLMYRLRAKVEIRPLDLRVFSGLLQGPEWVDDPRLPELGRRGYLPAGLPADPEGAYTALRIRLGVPGASDWGHDKTYPIEADFDLLNGIDFQKGCFVGQETTSRMKRRGAVKTRMLPISFEGPPPGFGTEVLAGTLRAGEVRSGIEGRAIALLRLDRVEGADLTMDGRPVRVETPKWFRP